MLSHTDQYEYLSSSKASLVAETLQKGDKSGWLYLVIPYQGGYRVAVFDENRVFVAYWGGF
jgi:hypothetical protein